MSDVLIIGSGGREHAMAWKIAQSPSVNKVYVAPGNYGTSIEGKCINVDIDIADPVAVARFAWPRRIDLTIVGPEQPLANGIVNVFNESNLPIFGPTKEAALLETSKIYTKELLEKLGVPTAPFISTSSFETAKQYIESHFSDNDRIVIKADGLCKGKGVFIEKTKREAIGTCHKILSDRMLGDAGSKILIEDFIPGIELSLICFVQGHNIMPLQLAQDYKKSMEDNGGKNTGGMGSYSPVSLLSNDDRNKLVKGIMYPVVNRMMEKGTPFNGFLYAGIVIDKNGVANVLEFNTRCGDPETQVLLPRLKSDFFELCSAVANNNLAGKQIEWYSVSSVGIVLASKGYPDDYETNFPIIGLDKANAIENTKVFHCATKPGITGTILTNGGRVLTVVGIGRNQQEARSIAYGRISRIRFENMYYRTDIGSSISRTTMG